MAMATTTDIYVNDCTKVIANEIEQLTEDYMDEMVDRMLMMQDFQMGTEDLNELDENFFNEMMMAGSTEVVDVMESDQGTVFKLSIGSPMFDGHSISGTAIDKVDESVYNAAVEQRQNIAIDKPISIFSSKLSLIPEQYRNMINLLIEAAWLTDWYKEQLYYSPYKIQRDNKDENVEDRNPVYVKVTRKDCNAGFVILKLVCIRSLLNQLKRVRTLIPFQPDVNFKQPEDKCSTRRGVPLSIDLDPNLIERLLETTYTTNVTTEQDDRQRRSTLKCQQVLKGTHPRVLYTHP
ncbi:unnamed protein product [Didymodactylos carnosus]|uniref:Uncharacterized protein n=1 Tax=Didymodactylos carnosus TaxID=1234261 RepID=A0A815MNA3_9BILA|nr:unnamed protein product [Didymodactylos carnosus]CAF4306410.1 unnamed protein product [Didymodactylos carnosus]